MPARTAVLGIAQEAGRFAHLRCRCSWPGRVAGQRWIFGAGLVRVSPRAGRFTRPGWPVQLAGQGGSGSWIVRTGSTFVLRTSKPTAGGFARPTRRRRGRRTRGRAPDGGPVLARVIPPSEA